MNTKTHTPGKWTLGREELLDEGGRVCHIDAPSWAELASVVVGMEHEAGNSPEGEGNARLIAAAPDLLEALEVACSLLDTVDGCGIKVAEFRAALSRAKGAE